MSGSTTRHAIRICAAATLTLLTICSCILPAKSDELKDRRAFWEDDGQAFYCQASANPFPSKYAVADVHHCDDGDMTLFNGLLCSAGDARGCDAVRDAQGPDGRWWRSPRRIGWEAPAHDVSFSPDQSLGVLLFALERRETQPFAAWLAWIASNRPCQITVGDKCLKRGWLRFCSDDFDNRCALRPADCVRLELVAVALGVDGSLCRKVMKELGMPSSILLPIEDFLLASASANDLGFPLHLAAVGVLVAKKSGVASARLNDAAAIIASRDPENPFFVWLNDGKPGMVTNTLLRRCPSPERRSTIRFQWTWEREYSVHSWQESMYWECIFIAELLD